MNTRTFTGHCHCGNLALDFETAVPAARMPVRACACTFCRSHGVRAVADPAGGVRFTVRDCDRLSRYRFGLETADFLVCRDCGVYLAAVMADGEDRYATLNINAFDAAQVFTRPAVAVRYDDESAAERRARRRANWTPVWALPA